jgi:hypothetical protein
MNTNTTRQLIATAQVLPALKRDAATVQSGASQNDASHDMCVRAMDMARQSAPMYEGFMSQLELYVGIIGIMNSRVVEIGEE